MTKHLPHLWDLCTTEIIVRSAKHILKVSKFFHHSTLVPIFLFDYFIYNVQIFDFSDMFPSSCVRGMFALRACMCLANLFR